MEITRRAIEFGTLEIFGLSISPTIHWYGVIIVLGIIAAATIVARLAARDNDDPDIVWNGVLWVVIAGVIGARLWSVVFPAGDDGAGRELSLDYLLDLDNGPLAIWSGGLSIFGAVLGGLIALVIFARNHDLNIPIWVDRAAVGLPLAQAIGRWGNYVNQELYGEPSNLPWAITIDNPLPPHEPGTTFHPLFLYESLWNLLLFVGLYYLYTRRRELMQRWDFFIIYLAGYSTVRFLLEFIRLEVPLVNGVNVSQVVTGIVAVLAIAVFVMRHRSDRLTAEPYLPIGTSTRRKGKKSSRKTRRARTS